MSLLTATKTGPRPLKRGPLCTVTKAIRDLEAKIAAADADHEGSASEASAKLANLYLILEQRDDAGEYVWPGSAVAAELRDDGYDVKGPAVNRHRRAGDGGCTCETL